MASPTLPEKIESIVRAWDGWSNAERRKMDEILEEILEYCRSGKGNNFIRSWCERILIPKTK